MIKLIEISLLSVTFFKNHYSYSKQQSHPFYLECLYSTYHRLTREYQPIMFSLIYQTRSWANKCVIESIILLNWFNVCVYIKMRETLQKHFIKYIPKLSHDFTWMSEKSNCSLPRHNIRWPEILLLQYTYINNSISNELGKIYNEKSFHYLRKDYFSKIFVWY
jgi:hypothetical protein